MRQHQTPAADRTPPDVMTVPIAPQEFTDEGVFAVCRCGARIRLEDRRDRESFSLKEYADHYEREHVDPLWPLPTKLEAAPYYDEDEDGEEFIAGWGIWARYEEDENGNAEWDWYMEGYETQDDAREAVDRLRRCTTKYQVARFNERPYPEDYYKAGGSQNPQEAVQVKRPIVCRSEDGEFTRHRWRCAANYRDDLGLEVCYRCSYVRIVHDGAAMDLNKLRREVDLLFRQVQRDLP